MTNDQFTRPVIIMTGLGHPTAVSSAMEAYMFLADWTTSRRDAVQGLAMKACQAVLRGEVEAETARGLFASWAERQDILARDLSSFMISRRAGSHGTA